MIRRGSKDFATESDSDRNRNLRRRWQHPQRQKVPKPPSKTLITAWRDFQAPDPFKNGQRKMSAPGDITRDLRTASALCRERDWRGLVYYFEGSDFTPLKLLAEATSTALYSFLPHQIGPLQIMELAHPQAREIVAAWLDIFGCQA